MRQTCYRPNFHTLENVDNLHSNKSLNPLQSMKSLNPALQHEEEKENTIKNMKTIDSVEDAYEFVSIVEK